LTNPAESNINKLNKFISTGRSGHSCQ